MQTPHIFVFFKTGCFIEMCIFSEDLLLYAISESWFMFN